MAPYAERRSDPGDGDGGQPQESVVGVPLWAHLESRRLFQGGASEPQKCGCPVRAGRIQPNRMERYRLAMAEQGRLAAAAALKCKSN